MYTKKELLEKCIDVHKETGQGVTAKLFAFYPDLMAKFKELEKEGKVVFVKDRENAEWIVPPNCYHPWGTSLEMQYLHFVRAFLNVCKLDPNDKVAYEKWLEDNKEGLENLKNL